MLVYGDAWKSVPDPFPSITLYAKISGDASIDADARRGYALTVDRLWKNLYISVRFMEFFLIAIKQM